MDELVLFSILLFGFFLRLPFSLLSPLSSTNDGSGTFSKLNTLSKQLLPKLRIDDAVNHEGYFPRPNLFHWLVSRFPKKRWRLVIVFGNVLPDIILAALLYALLRWFFPEIQANLRHLIVLLFVSAPIFFPYTARLKATNGRTVGFLLASLYLLCLPILDSGVFEIHPGFIFIFLCLVAFLTFWTSTFASQAMVFVSLVYAVISLNPIFALPIILVLGLSFLFRRLGIWDILLFKIYHTKFYSKLLLTSFSTRERSLLNFWKLLDPRLTRTSRLELILKHSPLIIALYSVPILFPLSYLIVLDPTSIYFGEGVLGPINLLSLSILIVFLLTSSSLGKLFGEAERYLEYSVIPLLLLLASLIANSSGISLLLSLVLGQLCIIVLVTILNWPGALEKLFSFQKGIPEDADKVVDYIKQHDSSARILCVPFRASRLLSSAGKLKQIAGLKYYYQLVASEGSTSNFLQVSMDEMLGQNQWNTTEIPIR